MKWRTACNLAAALVALLVFLATFNNGHFALGRMSVHYRYLGAIDWPIFVQSAHDFIHSGTLYNHTIAEYAPGAAIYKFPPLFISVVITLFQHDFPEPDVTYWSAVSQIILYFVSVLICYLFVKKENRFIYFCLAFLLAITFDPFVDTFGRLQLETYLLWLICLAMILFSQQWFISAGVFLGFAAALKLYPIFFAAYFVFAKSWRALLGLVLGLVMTLPFTVSTLGWQEHYHYYHTILPTLLQEPVSAGLENISVPALFLRAGFSQGWAATISALILGMALLVISRGASSSIQERRAPIAISFAVLTAALVAGMKNSWLNYQLLLILPMMVILGLALGRKYFDVVSIVGVILSALFIFYGRPYRLLAWSHLLTHLSLVEWAALSRAVANALVLLISVRLHLKISRASNVAITPPTQNRIC